jgi:hypothetical protein
LTAMIPTVTTGNARVGTLSRSGSTSGSYRITSAAGAFCPRTRFVDSAG